MLTLTPTISHKSDCFSILLLDKMMQETKMPVATDRKITKMFWFAVSWWGFRAFHHGGLVFYSSPAWNDPYSFHLFSESSWWSFGALLGPPGSLSITPPAPGGQCASRTWAGGLRAICPCSVARIPFLVLESGLWVSGLTISWLWGHEYE